MEYTTIKYQTENAIATITLNRPPANSVNLNTVIDVEKALDDAEKDVNVRVVIFTGAGEKGFCAGFDVSDAENAAETGPRGRALWTRIDRFPKPTIAAINGYAFGGGCELGMACTFRVMQENAKIGLTELNLGIIPAWGGTQRLPRLVGKSKALDMILFSKRITAAEAFEIGLVDKVSKEGELMNDVMAMASVLSKRPPIAVRAVLNAVMTGIEKGFEEGIKMEAIGSDQVQASKDAFEGFAAFLEKREANFKGE
jgi:enoyl-CoA hydratase/carnithine racemase